MTVLRYKREGEEGPGRVNKTLIYVLVSVISMWIGAFGFILNRESRLRTVEVQVENELLGYRAALSEINRRLDGMRTEFRDDIREIGQKMDRHLEKH